MTVGFCRSCRCLSITSGPAIRKRRVLVSRHASPVLGMKNLSNVVAFLAVASVLGYLFALILSA